MAAVAGCDVAAYVSKKTTILFVGTQDKSKLKGYEKSTRHRKAETLMEKGVDIQILSESDFSELIVGTKGVPYWRGFRPQPRRAGTRPG